MPSRQSDSLERFTADLNAAGLRIALLPTHQRASAVENEAAVYPVGPIREFARSFLGMVVAGVKADGMKPKEYFAVLGVGLVVLVLLLVISVSLARYLGGGVREAIALTFGGLFFVSLLAINLAVANPSASQLRAFNVYLALAAAAAGAGLPGFISVSGQSAPFSFSAGGALALFLLVLWWRPVGEKKS